MVTLGVSSSFLCVLDLEPWMDTPHGVDEAGFGALPPQKEGRVQEQLFITPAREELPRPPSPSPRKIFAHPALFTPGDSPNSLERFFRIFRLACLGQIPGKGSSAITRHMLNMAREDLARQYPGVYGFREIAFDSADLDPQGLIGGLTKSQSRSDPRAMPLIPRLDRPTAELVRLLAQKIVPAIQGEKNLSLEAILNLKTDQRKTKGAQAESYRVELSGCPLSDEIFYRALGLRDTYNPDEMINKIRKAMECVKSATTAHKSLDISFQKKFGTFRRRGELIGNRENSEDANKYLSALNKLGEEVVRSKRTSNPSQAIRKVLVEFLISIPPLEGFDKILFEELGVRPDLGVEEFIELLRTGELKRDKTEEHRLQFLQALALQILSLMDRGDVFPDFVFTGQASNSLDAIRIYHNEHPGILALLLNAKHPVGLALVWLKFIREEED